MRKLFHSAPIALVFILVLGLMVVNRAFALELSSVWELKLTADDLTSDADFGRSVAIDGNLVAVGAGAADAGSMTKAGAVYLFKRRGLDYLLEAKLDIGMTEN